MPRTATITCAPAGTSAVTSAATRSVTAAGRRGARSSSPSAGAGAGGRCARGARSPRRTASSRTTTLLSSPPSTASSAAHDSLDGRAEADGRRRGLPRGPHRDRDRGEQDTATRHGHSSDRRCPPRVEDGWRPCKVGRRCVDKRNTPRRMWVIAGPATYTAVIPLIVAPRVIAAEIGPMGYLYAGWVDEGVTGATCLVHDERPQDRRRLRCCCAPSPARPVSPPPGTRRSARATRRDAAGVRGGRDLRDRADRAGGRAPRPRRRRRARPSSSRARRAPSARPAGPRRRAPRASCAGTRRAR